MEEINIVMAGYSAESSNQEEQQDIVELLRKGTK